MNALEKLKVAKLKADKSQVDRDNYAAYIADRNENGEWTQDDVVEYRDEVERIMKSGTDDEKAAASEFWAMKVDSNSAYGVNSRIRKTLASDRRMAA